LDSFPSARQEQAAVLVTTTGQQQPKHQKPNVTTNNKAEDIAVLKDRLNAIDKEQELIIDILQGVITKNEIR
jgi:hypothetical protein